MDKFFEKEVHKIQKYIKWLAKHPDQARILLQVVGIIDEEGNLTEEYKDKSKPVLLHNTDKKQLTIQNVFCYFL